MDAPTARELDLLDWRRTVAAIYAEVRAEPDPRRAHDLWRRGRDELFRHHRQSPLPPDDPLRDTGLPYFPYDERFRVDVDLQPPEREQTLSVDSADDGAIRQRLIGHVDVPAPVGARLDVWWLDQYAGGVFLPVRDGTAGHQSYGGGRYLLDTAKGADLGSRGRSVTLDFNFLYHPSCRYDPRWQCPLAPPGNTIRVPVPAGETL